MFSTRNTQTIKITIGQPKTTINTLNGEKNGGASEIRSTHFCPPIVNCKRYVLTFFLETELRF